MSDAEKIKEHAARLFALASEARGEGHHGWADALISLASEVLEQAVSMEAQLSRTPTASPHAEQPAEADDPRNVDG